jgi:hypothetical protein
MTPARVVGRGGRRYAYYVCTRAQTRGWDTCPSKSVSAPSLERFVLQQLLALPAPPPAAEAGKPDRGPLAEHRTTIDPNRLSAVDRVHLVRSRVERVDYDGAAGKVAIAVRSGEDTGELQGAGLSETEGIKA